MISSSTPSLQLATARLLIILPTFSIIIEMNNSQITGTVGTRNCDRHSTAQSDFDVGFFYLLCAKSMLAE